jgi:glucokinase
VLGLDVGGTKLAAGVVGSDGSVRSWLSTPSHVEEGPDAVIARHLELGRSAVDKAALTWADVAAVGIGCGGPLDPFRGVVEAPLHLPGWNDVPLVDIVEKALDRPAVVDNDATAGALGEYWFGAGRERGIRHLVYLTISTGVGGGLILDGRVYRGANGNAGELGHLTIERNGRPCACGRRGCLEAYASGTNIARRAREAITSGDWSGPSTLSTLSTLSEITARDVSAAAAVGDPLATRIWDETTDILGAAVATILDVFNPDLVVLGGGVTRAGEQLLRPVRGVALGRGLPPARRAADVVLARLGDQLGVVAAAAVAFERLLNLRPTRAAQVAHA